MKAFTDYPLEELGDAIGSKAPIRECDVLSYDGNKYCIIEVGGIKQEVKSGYLYKKPGRCGGSPPIDFWKMKRS